MKKLFKLYSLIIILVCITFNLKAQDTDPKKPQETDYSSGTAGNIESLEEESETNNDSRPPKPPRGDDEDAVPTNDSRPPKKSDSLEETQVDERPNENNAVDNSKENSTLDVNYGETENIEVRYIISIIESLSNAGSQCSEYAKQYLDTQNLGNKEIVMECLDQEIKHIKTNDRRAKKEELKILRNVKRKIKKSKAK